MEYILINCSLPNFFQKLPISTGVEKLQNSTTLWAERKKNWVLNCQGHEQFNIQLVKEWMKKYGVKSRYYIIVKRWVLKTKTTLRDFYYTAKVLL